MNIMKIMQCSRTLCAVFILIISGCMMEEKAKLTVSGKLVNSITGQKIYFDRIDVSGIFPMDSADVDDHGSFIMRPKVSSLGFYRLRFSQTNYLTLVVDTVGALMIDADANNIGLTYRISGSAESDHLRKVHQAIIRSNMQMDSLRQVFAAYQNSPQRDSILPLLDAHYKMIFEAQRNFLRNFIDSNLYDFACLSAVNYLNPETDAEYYSKVADALKAKFPSSPFVKNLVDRAQQLSRLSPGTVAPEIVLHDPDGKSVALSSLRGKFVLIDFWASWCRPCRMENPNVVRMYKKFKKKGFEIFGVSLDKNRDAWMGAIKSDDLTWVHVSDLAYWNSAVVKLYDIQGIPMTVLLDKEGKVIAKNLRGPALENKLEEVLR